MAAIGIITFFLTCFVMIYFGYLAEHTDHDVSFFLAVGIISIVMNLCTNSGAIWGLAWVYLIVDVAFLAAGFLISRSGSVAFYTSIVPWFKNTFADKMIGVKLLSFLVPPAGAVLYGINYRKDGEISAVSGKAGIWGLLVWLLMLWFVLGLV